MPLGKSLGEFSSTITSFKQTDLKSGRIRVEYNTTGEVTGQFAGRSLWSLTAEGKMGLPAPWSVNGLLMRETGPARFNASGYGVGQPGNTVHLRGAFHFLGDDDNADPSTARRVGAIEAEVDLFEQKVKGELFEWV